MTSIRLKRDKPRTVKLFILEYCDGEYSLRETETTFPELPRDAVHITGRKNKYFLDTVRASEPSSGITAADLNLYMLNNSINDALAMHWTAPKDLQKYIVYGIAGIILVCVVYALM